MKKAGKKEGKEEGCGWWGSLFSIFHSCVFHFALLRV
jgi:hypothetical protein